MQLELSLKRQHIDTQELQYVLKPEVIAPYIFTKEFKWMKMINKKMLHGGREKVNAQKNNLFRTFYFPFFFEHANEGNEWQYKSDRGLNESYKNLTKLLLFVSCVNL